jgi:uncharacterized damage-inducible protein DinB
VAVLVIRLYDLSMAHKFTVSYLEDSKRLFAYYKKLGEDAMGQVRNEELTQALDSESNSIAIIVKHMSGNMRSRWTRLLTSDGEKPDRNRDSEFTDPPQDRQALLEIWNEGWATLFCALDSLTDADLTRTVTVRGEEHSVMQAINRQIAHYAYHVGQIVALAKHFRGEEWRSLTIPRNRSAEVTRRAAAGQSGAK